MSGLQGTSEAVFTRKRFHLYPYQTMRLRLLFTRHRSRSLAKHGRFENAAKSGAFLKPYGFTCRVNTQAALI